MATKPPTSATEQVDRELAQRAIKKISAGQTPTVQEQASLKRFEKQREEWERQYAEAHVRYEQHIAQLKKSAEADAAAGAEEGAGGVPAQYSSDGGAAEGGGSLASDEQLAALREKLSGGA